KEYNTMLQQIQDAKADASRVEDTILIIMEKNEISRKDIEEEKKKLNEDEKIFNEQKKKAEGRLKEIEDKLAVMAAQRNALLPGIENRILSHYDRILKNREGLAIVEARSSTCMGCNMFVPAQVENLIKMYERIITCDVCNRILFIADEQA
ncbi:MAG: C4-type zinc ribbon domain-containing protein, partial [Candidatus Omnitrophota bacterium]